MKNVTKSMTEGNPLKLMLQFALPLFIGNLLQQTYNIIDAAIVGRFLGQDALASVGASSSVQFLVLGFCIGICCGFAVPVAKWFGARDYDRMRNYIFQAMILTVGIAVVLTAVCAILCPQILHLLSTPEDIYDGAYQYLLVIFLGIPATLLYNFLAGILRSVGDSKTPFLFLACSTVLNIFLDLLCIIVLHWGCAGAAIATITAQAVSGILCLIFIHKRFEILHLGKEDRKMSGAVTKDLIVMGIPMGLQYSITAIGSMVMQSANNSLGSVYVSGFTAGMRIKQFFMCPFDAVATAVSVFCGQNLGAGKIERIKKGIRQGVMVGVTYGLIAGIILIFAGRTLSLIFVKSSATAVLDASAKYLRCMGYFFWSLGILNVCRMTTQGLGFSGRAIFSGMTEMVARIFVSMVFVSTYGFTAICFADQTAWISACFYIVPVCISCVKRVSKTVK
ncbi:MATE family efflux transporter [Roseburia sp. MSJ-14]|uniref:MATE family efflux transporter n=1 Tax=Roseburia sp. MSJ-14 TaxID=2841514 RepID=UPI0020A01B08|nr:MATE family efflux transporter [Roseburia sp. MSJ-14]